MEYGVSVQIDGEDVFAGTLYAHVRRGVESASFRYDVASQLFDEQRHAVARLAIGTLAPAETVRALDAVHEEIRER